MGDVNDGDGSVDTRSEVTDVLVIPSRVSFPSSDLSKRTHVRILQSTLDGEAGLPLELVVGDLGSVADERGSGKELPDELHEKRSSNAGLVRQSHRLGEDFNDT